MPGFFFVRAVPKLGERKARGAPGCCECGSVECGSEFCVLYEGLNKGAVFRKFGNGLGDLVLYAF